jgi:hypothetical protein
MLYTRNSMLPQSGCGSCSKSSGVQYRDQSDGRSSIEADEQESRHRSGIMALAGVVPYVMITAEHESSAG